MLNNIHACAFVCMCEHLPVVGFSDVLADDTNLELLENCATVRVLYTGGGAVAHYDTVKTRTTVCCLPRYFCITIGSVQSEYSLLFLSPTICASAFTTDQLDFNDSFDWLSMAVRHENRGYFCILTGIRALAL